MGKRTPGTPREPRPAGKKVRFNLGDAKADFQGRTNVQKGIRTIAPNAPKMNAAIKAQLDQWSKDTDAAELIWDDIISTEASLEQKYGTLGTLVTQINLDRAGFIVAAQAVCTTPADAKSFGANDPTMAKHGNPVAPGTLRQILTKVPGENRLRWPSEPYAVAYMAQTSPDPKTATSFSTVYTGSSPFFLLQGTPGEKVWVQLASIGRSTSGWSTPVLVTLR